MNTSRKRSIACRLRVRDRRLTGRPVKMSYDELLQRLTLRLAFTFTLIGMASTGRAVHCRPPLLLSSKTARCELTASSGSALGEDRGVPSFQAPNDSLVHL